MDHTLVPSLEAISPSTLDGGGSSSYDVSIPLGRLSLIGSQVNAIIFGGVLLLFLFSFPETLYSREKFSNLEEKSYWDRFAFSGKVLDRKLRLKDFANNFIMLKYAAVVIPCFYYCT